MNRYINRRTVLRGLGVSMALPLLDGMVPLAGAVNAKPPMRFVATLLPFGIYSNSFHPKAAGSDYVMPEVLATMERHRADMTVLSGIDHGVVGGHQATHTALSGITHTQAAAFPDGNIGLDQRMAEHTGGATRLSSLCLGSTGRIGAGWTRSGVAVPPMATPLEAFNRLFLDPGPEARSERRRFLASGQSVMDAVNASAKSFSRSLTAADRSKLDEYFTAVRETEKGLETSAQWIDRPLPKAPGRAPKVSADNVEGYMAAWFDVARLALQTDSTRVVTLSPMHQVSPSLLPGVENGYHALSHHGQAEDRVHQLKLTEKFVHNQLARFYDQLKEVRQVDGSRLFDSTMVLFTSGMGDGSRHTNSNVPVILGGGGFKHGQHLAVNHQQPLNSLYLSLAQRYGIETDHFNTSKGTLAGLETA